MEDRALIDVLTDLAGYINTIDSANGDANGGQILEDPVRFRSLFLDFSENQYKAEARIFREFLSSREAELLKTGDGVNTAILRAIAERFHKESRFDPGDCKMAVTACAWFMGLIDRRAFEAALGGEAAKVTAKANAAGTISAAAPQSMPEGLEFEFADDRSVTITRYAGDASAIVIPARIMGMSVTAIGLGAFKGCDNLISITLPFSVTLIGDGVFLGCRSLASFTIPPSVKSIGKGMFSNCANLTSIIIPPSVVTIDELAFSYCARLASITIPPSVVTIGEWAFRDCRSLASITIPSSVSSIGDWAFFHCGSLTSVTIPRHTRVEDGTFPYSTRITYSD